MFRKLMLAGGAVVLSAGIAGCSDAPDETASPADKNDSDIQEKNDQPAEETKDQSEKVEDIKQSRSSNSEQESNSTDKADNGNNNANQERSNNNADQSQDEPKKSDESAGYAHRDILEMSPDERADLSQATKNEHQIKDNGEMQQPMGNDDKNSQKDELGPYAKDGYRGKVPISERERKTVPPSKNNDITREHIENLTKEERSKLAKEIKEQFNIAGDGTLASEIEKK